MTLSEANIKLRPSPGVSNSRLSLMIAAADAAHVQAAAIGKKAGSVAAQPGLAPAVADIGPADDGIIGDNPGGGTASDQVDDPGTVVIDQDPRARVDAPGLPWVPDPGTFIPGNPVVLPPLMPDPGTFIPGNPVVLPPLMPWPGLMDPRYVLEPVAIALGGGGSVGDFELGALDFIYTQFLGSSTGAALGFSRPRVDIATGTSVGAVNAGAIAQGAAGSMEELKKIWFDMQTSDNFYVLNDVFSHFIGNQEDNFGTSAARILHNVIFNGEEYSKLVAQPAIMNPEPLAKLCRDIECYWSPGGPGLRGASVSVARDLQGHRIVFVRGYDDMLYVRWQLDTNPISAATQWSRWSSLGGPISSDPVAYSTGFIPAPTDNPLRVGVIARQANEEQYGGCTLDAFDDITHVDTVAPTDYYPFQEWSDVPPPPAPNRHYHSQPTIVQRAPDGRAWAFCHDGFKNSPNGTFTYYSTWNGNQWGNWIQFGVNRNRIAGNITGCSYGIETLELFARTADFSILYSFTSSGSAPGNWEDWGGAGRATSDLLVVLTEDPEYMVDVFWRGIDGQVWARRKVGGRGSWGSPRNLGGIITSNLCSGRNSDGICTIFARGLDDKLYELRQTSVNGDWPANAWNYVGAPPGLTLLADPYTLVATPTSWFAIQGIEVYAVASDQSVWTIRQRPDGTYTDWISLGGKVWTGMKLRMCVVALEDGLVRYVEEAGRFVDDFGSFAGIRDGAIELIVSSDGDISFARAQGAIESIVSNNGDISCARAQGAIASCSAPAVFPAISLNGRSWVDGGIRRGVPIGAAIVAGATKVIAISTVPLYISPVAPLLTRTLAEPPPSLEDFIKTSIGQPPEHRKIKDYSQAGVLDVLTRSFVELLVDATSWSELDPPTRWPVPVWNIQQTFKIHEGGTIDPGLIRINYSYGWLRAFDILMASPEARRAAIESTDRIINARWGAWKAEMAFREAYLVATWQDASVRASKGTGHIIGTDSGLAQTRAAADFAAKWLRESRRCKRKLETALRDRRDTLGLPLDPESPLWLSQFEMYAPPSHWTAQWKSQLEVLESAFWDANSPFNQLTIRGMGNNPYFVGPEPMPTL
jgi:predicted acylesterase/phospholipase RssA